LSNTEGQDPIVRKILAGEAQTALRSAAARGALPLPRTALVRLYVALREDDDEQVRSEAEASLAGLDEPAIVEVLADAECAPEVLEFFAPRAIKQENIAERIAFHPAVPAAALSLLAAQGNSKVIDLVLTNQQRLLTQHDLLDQLTSNPALRADQRGRILELLDRLMRARESSGPDDDDAESGDVTAEMEEAARLLHVDVGELFAASEILGGEEFEDAADVQVRTAYHRILTLNTAQKAILAMRGGREERSILVRDTNKLVSLAVLRNPRINDDDVEMFARLRNITTDVLRDIGLNREWLKSNSIVIALVNNPRTPPSVSTNLVSRLQNQELKKLLTNHDVPELIRRMARRTHDLRTQKKKH